MKCPICGEELLDAGDAEYSVKCYNKACFFGENNQFFGSEELFEEYAKTKQALDVAVKELKASDRYYQDDEHIKKALDRIKQIIGEQR